MAAEKRDLHFFLKGKSEQGYVAAFKEKIELIKPGLSSNADEFAKLEGEPAFAMLKYALSLGCECQNIMNIEIGRATILAMQKKFVEDHIEAVAEPLLQDEWCYRRLVEICEKLDATLLHRLLQRASQSENVEIRGIAEDYGLNTD